MELDAPRDDPDKPCGIDAVAQPECLDFVNDLVYLSARKRIMRYRQRAAARRRCCSATAGSATVASAA
jgi:hypothetical protein